MRTWGFNKCSNTLNPSDIYSPFLLDDSLLTVTNIYTNSRWRGGRAITGFTTGYCLFEAFVNPGSYFQVGLANETTNLFLSNAYLGGSGISFGITYNSSLSFYGLGFTLTRPITFSTYDGGYFMFACDFDRKELWISQNGVWDGGNPSTRSDPLIT